MVTRSIVRNPCQDACGTVLTDRRVDGHPVYLCPGCDSEWIEIDTPSRDASRDATVSPPNAD